MDLLALKGGLYEIIARIEDEQLLLQLQHLMKEVIDQDIAESDFWEELTAEQQATLDQALQESEQEDNLVAHQVILDKYQQWQKK